MKKTAIYLLILFAIGLVFFVWLTNKKPIKNNHVSQTDTNNVSGITTNVGEVNQPETQQHKMWSRPAGMDDAGWSYATKMWNLLMHENQPVKFYARVIDQNQQPVVGAVVELHLVRVDEGKVASPSFMFKPQGSELQTTTNVLITDSEGRGQLENATGRHLTVWNVAKDGYVWNRPDGFGTLTFETDGTTSASGKVGWGAFSDPAKGIVFQVWKKGETEGLIHLDTGITLSQENHSSWVNIVTGEVKFSPQLTADFTVFETLLHPSEPDRQYDRTMTIRGINGAKILETQDAFPYTAPESGYEPEFNFDVLPSTGYGPGGSWDWTKKFYVVARNGKVHAGLTVNFIGGKLTFEFNGYLNPTGSRNLEPDSAKIIADPIEIHRADEITRKK